MPDAEKPSMPPEPLDLSKGVFMAVGHKGQRVASGDGQTWKNQQFGRDGEIYRGVAFGNGRFAAVGSYGGENILASTADGAQWNQGKKEARYVNYLRGLGFGNKVFLGLGGDPGSVGDSKPFIATSDDGIQWSDFAPIAGRNILRRVTWGHDLFVAVGDRGRRAVSTDGRTWTDAPDVKAIDTLVDVAHGNGVFVGVGLHGLRMATTDGLKWTSRQVGEEGEHLNTIVWTGDRFVAVGQGATFISPDGTTWQRLANRDAPFTMAYGNGAFVGSSWKGRLLFSTDGVDWRQVFKSAEHIESLAFGQSL
jgi:hypothetical protein